MYYIEYISFMFDVEMKGWFRFFDKNDDKQLDKEELKMVFHALCWTVNDDEVDKYFKVADADRKR